MIWARTACFLNVIIPIRAAFLCNKRLPDSISPHRGARGASGPNEQGVASQRGMTA